MIGSMKSFTPTTTYWVVFLCVLYYSDGDYPPHDPYYRLHITTLYPREEYGYQFIYPRPCLAYDLNNLNWECNDNNLARKPESTFCENRSDGNYQHYNIDFGDSKCTFVTCSNERTILQSCPKGTRTSVDLLPDLGYVQWILNLKRNRIRAHILNDLDRKYFEADRKAEQNNRVERSGKVMTWIDYIQAYRSMFLIQGHGQDICRYHDVYGDCGDPFPDMNTFDNKISTVNNWA